ncbi:hypothetical protein P170DRAFT_431694 [Aspergillus steynii IBT 23096]|uniref:Uncharacterized protein n=1 Tax=Aspergillus steynii IBT 23096 TaxID=1392250 RepID=A0A2I2GM58_9EURO|nr:uncharacterized protein P170DRAFT_431694 [Aspergillus steynii IBT 23096]PLB53940.1 hypothetical protein P170DRAFT_431694 [Aspergillus steynii IBT 23096]
MNTPFPLDPNALYILLLDRGDSYLFHWALYLAKSASSGIMYHLINPDTTDPTTWKYEIQGISDGSYFSRVLLALKLGTLDPVVHDAVAGRLGDVPIQYSGRFKENVTCRVWLKEALYALDDEGYVELGRSVNEIDTEATHLAMINKSKRVRSVVTSRGCVV